MLLPPRSGRALRFHGEDGASIPVALRLEWARLRDAKILRLFWRHLGEFRTDHGEMQRSDLLVEMLGRQGVKPASRIGRAWRSIACSLVEPNSYLAHFIKALIALGNGEPDPSLAHLVHQNFVNRAMCR